jgi:hypothetical protein
MKQPAVSWHPCRSHHVVGGCDSSAPSAPRFGLEVDVTAGADARPAMASLCDCRQPPPVSSLGGGAPALTASRPASNDLVKTGAKPG